MYIVIAAATQFELNALGKNILSKKHTFEYIVTGIGAMATTMSLTQLIIEKKPDIIIQIGIAGAFNTNLNLAQVVVVQKEYLGDIGVVENDKWNDLFDMKFIEPNEKPFKQKALVNKKVDTFNTINLPVINAVTVNQISTQTQHIQQLKKKYKPNIETMEGAALHYICNSFNVQYLQVRSISNYVGERDKSKWKIKQALANLNVCTKKLLREL